MCTLYFMNNVQKFIVLSGSENKCSVEAVIANPTDNKIGR